MTEGKEIVLFESEDGKVSLPVQVDMATNDVWLTRQNMAELFGRDVKTIGKHVGNALKEELAGSKNRTVAKFATVQTEGDRTVERQVEHYSLDMILSVGYRVKSQRGVEFRRWATDVLRRYIIDGHAENKKRLQQLGQVARIMARIPDTLQDGDVMVEGDALYEFRKLGKTTERNFEDDVEAILGLAGWRTFGNAAAQADYDRKLALKVDSLVGFVKETQPEEWAKIEGLYGSHTRERFLKRLCDELEPHDERGGVVNVLRHGIRMAPGAQFRLCYFRPATEKNPDALARYRANRFEVVRQLRYGTMPDDAGNSVDVVLFLNGIPVVTMELKNNLTGQRTEHAVRQYRTDRSPKEPLFKANRRAVVHFALDSETVEMCTWLANGKSRFLPFNRGNGRNGAGNPPNPHGYRTEYLYREILAPDSLLDIIQRFVRVEYDPDTHAMRKIIFPRFHQLDAVRKLVADAKASGAGKSYLIQHSAGSGKSNSIAWLAHHLQSLHDADDNPVFDTVVILTDRPNLDAQLSETIDAVEHKRGVVVRIREEDGSAGLREALNSGAQIITSTIQKFPYICSETKVSGRKFSVIIDEAHSSQSGKANAKMKLALIDRDLDPDEPWDDEDELAKEMKAQGAIPNISFFAFTATPKAATLEVFGTRDGQCRRDEDGMPIPRPFHLYSMRQAIDEGFILDVLENYTCFESYFKLVKTIADDPKYKEMKANRALMGIVDWNPAMIGSKAQIIVEHFMNDVEGVLGGKSKAMVVTWSRPPIVYRRCNADDE